MTYERLDKACRAKVLSVTGNEVLIHATWPATDRDKRRHFRIENGVANNICCVSISYFQLRYGVGL